jgi:signal transduction histidine kinase
MTAYLPGLLVSLILVLVFVLMLYILVIWRRSVKLEQENQTLELIVKEKTNEIEEMNLQLKTRSGEFLANISQDFRTPLTLIMLPLEQMIENSQDKETKEGLNLMMKNSQQLLSLINRLPHLYNRFLQEENKGKSNDQTNTK